MKTTMITPIADLMNHEDACFLITLNMMASGKLVEGVGEINNFVVNAQRTTLDYHSIFCITTYGRWNLYEYIGNNKNP